MFIPSSTYRAALARFSPLIFGLAMVACDSTTAGSGSGGGMGTGGTGGGGGTMGTGGAGGGGGTMGTGGAGGVMGTGGAGGSMGTGGAGGMGCGGSSDCNGSLWSKNFGDSNIQFAWSTAVDASGNIFITGSFKGTVDFGGGPLTAMNGYDMYVAKFDSAGNHLWSKRFGGYFDQFPEAIAVDAAGNVVISGYFMGDVDFGGGPLIWAGSDDIFVAELDPDGNHIWSKKFGDSGGQRALATAVDANGNVLITGFFGSTVDFGGGILTNTGNGSLFVAKFDPTGNHLWSKKFVGSSSQIGYAMAVDASGNVLLTGGFQETVDCGGGPLMSAGQADIFVVELDPDGNHLWSRRFGGADQESASSIAVDAAGNILISGNTWGTVDFGGGPLTSAGNDDIVVVKLDPSGNHVWSKRFGDPDIHQFGDVAVDAAGNVLLHGSFRGTVDFGGGALVGVGDDDDFVAKFDPDGNHLWSRRFGDAGQQRAAGAAVDAAGNLVVVGYFDGAIDFGNGPLESKDNPDIFLAKLTP